MEQHGADESEFARSASAGLGRFRPSPRPLEQATRETIARRGAGSAPTVVSSSTHARDETPSGALSHETLVVNPPAVVRHARVQNRTGARRRFGGAGALFAVCVVLTFLNFAIWSIATPLYASPDEPSQALRAVAAVRGELVGGTINNVTNALTRVSVPAVFAAAGGYPVCFAFHPTVPASCARPMTSSTRTETVGTYSGRYPPLYFVVVGLPSLAFASKTGVYLMRLTSALLNALLISLALLSVVLWSRRKLLLLGVMVAATPMTWFLGGMINPSGFEICAAICLWTSGLVLALEHAERPPPGLVAVVALTTGLLLLARPISPFWVALIFAVLCLLGGWRAISGVLRSRAARWAALPLVACSAFALWWIDAEHSLDLQPGLRVSHAESGLHLVATLFGMTQAWSEQMVGYFGWLTTPSPEFTYVIWLGVIVAVVVLAVWSPGIRRVAALLLLAAAVVVVPVALSYMEAHRLGIVWQGRYTLPLAAGIPLVAVALAERSPRLERFGRLGAVVLAIMLAVADIGAFLESLRRYAVGVTGPLDFLGAKWHPPLGLLGAAVGGSACIVVLLGFVVVGTRRRRLIIDGEPGHLGAHR